MIDFGIVKPGTTLYIPFATYDSNDPSASVTLTGLATTDIEVYKNGSTTQRSSDSGFALLDTDGIDFDTTTGIHGFSIDLADNTDAGFYSAGAQYWVVVASVTVDAATINFVAATFRIGYPAAVLNTTVATLASQTSFTLTSGPAEDDSLNGYEILFHDVASAVQIGRAVILDYTGSTKTVTLAAATTFTVAATDNVAILGPSPVMPTTAGRTLDVSATGEAGVDWGNVGSQSSSVTLSGTTIATTQKVDVETIKTQALTAAAGITFGVYVGGTAAHALASGVIVTTNNDKTGYSIGTGGITSGSFAAGAINAAAIATDAIDADALAADAVAEINATVDTALSDIGLHYLVNTALPTNWSTNITANSALDYMADDGTAVFDRTTDSLQAVRDHVGNGTNLTEAGGTGDQFTAIPWNASWDAEVESEVNDAIDTAISELGVAAPTATPTIRTAIMLMYMALRNKLVVQTSGTDAIEIYNDAGTKIASKLITDDGSDYTEAEMS